MSDVLLDVRNLTKHFRTARGTVHAVDGVSFSIKKGETLGIVGESGCGKTTTGRVILRLIEPTSGEALFDGRDIFKMKKQELTRARKDMQIVFQIGRASCRERV